LPSDVIMEIPSFKYIVKLLSEFSFKVWKAVNLFCIKKVFKINLFLEMRGL